MMTHDPNRYMVVDICTGSRTYPSDANRGIGQARRYIDGLDLSKHRVYIESTSPHRFTRAGKTAPGSERWVSLNPHIYPSTN